MFDDDDEILDDHCPRCRIGRIEVSSKPFLRLYHNHLFTIPDGVCYECDICGYYEFDETNYDIISDMLNAANSTRYNVSLSQALPPLPEEDDLPNQTKFPPI